MPETLFSLEEVSRHNGQFDAEIWIIIKDIVYNITNYLKSHPGGKELLLEYAGRDATVAFNDFGHSFDAKQTLKSFKIGVLIEEDKAVNRKKNIIITKRTKEKNSKKSRKLFIPFFQKCVN